ncbi:MAG: hypothetical protein JNL54_11205 [Kineosporiaceae bacterium]|nr:hypothetical protein [Kineosporiaceae bacterium]
MTQDVPAPSSGTGVRGVTAVAWAVAAVGGLLAVMPLDQRLRIGPAARGIVSYEVAGTARRAGAILEQWASSAVTGTAQLMMAIDLAYPLLYGFALLMGLRWAAARSGRTSRLPRLRWLALGAAGADYVENACLIWQLWAERATSASAGIAAGAAYLKFALILAALAAIALLSWRREGHPAE